MRSITAVVALALASGCADGPGAPRFRGPVDGPFVVLHVSGQVSTHDGTALANVALDVRARAPGTCSGELASDGVTTDGAGQFALTIGTWNVPRDVCLWIAVTPSGGSAPHILTREPARLGLAADTLHVSIVLPPPSS